MENKNVINNIKKEWNDLGYQFEPLLDCCINDFQILIIFNGSNKFTFYSDETIELKCDELGMRELLLFFETVKFLGWF